MLGMTSFETFLILFVAICSTAGVVKIIAVSVAKVKLKRLEILMAEYRKPIGILDALSEDKHGLHATGRLFDKDH